MGVASCLSEIVLSGQLVAEFCPLYGIGRLSAPRRLVCIETMLKSIRAKVSARYIEAVRSWEGPL